MDNTSIVLAKGNTLQLIENPDLDDFAKQLFTSFRKVFSAENLLERLIFWMEEIRGQFILRIVRNLNRRFKSEDFLVGKAGHSLATVRAAIGNFAADAGMTMVRWELYADFSLRELVSFGRFDFRDLLPDAESYAEINRCGMQICGDWDFDSIVLAHQCPNCGGVYNRSSIIHVPYIKCEKCGKVPTLYQTSLVISRLFRKFIRRSEIPVHKSIASGNGHAIQYFIDPLPNSIMYLLVSAPFLHSVADITKSDLLKPVELQSFPLVFQHSLFKFMTSQYNRENFRKYLRKIGERDFDLAIGLIRRFGEGISVASPGYIDELPIDISKNFISVVMPHLIDKVIMGTAMNSGKKARRKRRKEKK